MLGFVECVLFCCLCLVLDLRIVLCCIDKCDLVVCKKFDVLVYCIMWVVDDVSIL